MYLSYEYTNHLYYNMSCAAEKKARKEAKAKADAEADAA
jgi:hypothetical protein